MRDENSARRFVAFFSAMYKQNVKLYLIFWPKRWESENRTLSLNSMLIYFARLVRKLFLSFFCAIFIQPTLRWNEEWRTVQEVFFILKFPTLVETKWKCREQGFAPVFVIRVSEHTRQKQSNQIATSDFNVASFLLTSYTAKAVE